MKKHVFRKAGYCCEICDGQGPKWPVEAHERWKVEHPFHVIKNLFKHRKTRYRGLPKNAAQLFVWSGESDAGTQALAGL